MDNLSLKDPLIVLLIALAALVVVFLWPLAMIWSVNVLFGTEIPLSFRTWLATVILVSLLRLCVISSKKD